MFGIRKAHRIVATLVVKPMGRVGLLLAHRKLSVREGTLLIGLYLLHSGAYSVSPGLFSPANFEFVTLYTGHRETTQSIMNNNGVRLTRGTMFNC